MGRRLPIEDWISGAFHASRGRRWQFASTRWSGRSRRRALNSLRSTTSRRRASRRWWPRRFWVRNQERSMTK